MNEVKGKNILGIDLGSRNVKLCFMKNGEIDSTDCFETMTFYREYGIRAESGFSIDLDALGFDAVDRLIATGYGRTAAVLSGVDSVSELTAHFLGVRHQTGLNNFTLLDMGGQDYKVMKVKKGRIVDMATNDKCAASTGRYLENMARILGISLEDMGKYYSNPVSLTTTCAIFGESELIGLVVKGETVSRLAAGVNSAVVERVLPLLERMGSEVIIMTGGVALNHGVVRLVEIKTGRNVRVVRDPLHNGAIGCCIRVME